jgi:hypothetical protein
MEFMMDYDLFGREFLTDVNGMLTEVQWNCAFDYHGITIGTFRSWQVYMRSRKSGMQNTGAAWTLKCL